MRVKVRVGFRVRVRVRERVRVRVRWCYLVAHPIPRLSMGTPCCGGTLFNLPRCLSLVCHWVSCKVQLRVRVRVRLTFRERVRVWVRLALHCLVSFRHVVFVL